MKSSNELRTMLRGIDRKSYPAYKALAGAYQFGSYILVIDHVQGDPFASPSSVHVEIPWKVSGFAENLRVTIQALGWRDGGRYLPLQDDIASVAFWYQTLPTAPFPALPDREFLEII